MVKVKCAQCNARYGIPEERVRGRMLKIRCKNCRSIIEVWSSEGTIRSVIDRGKKVWFLVVKRQRIGPITEQEVRERFERGEVKAKTYGWRQGFSKWERLHDIPEFKDLDQETPNIASQVTRRGRVPLEDDPDRTEKARPPRAYLQSLEASSDDLQFDAPAQARQPDSSPVDSLARTAYPSTSGSDSLARTAVPSDSGSDSMARAAFPSDSGSDSLARTAYREVDRGSDARLTHVHMDDGGDPLAGLDSELDRHAVTSDFDSRAEDSWNRQFDDPESELPGESPHLRPGEWEQRMKGQRHDDSVLFSLGHLKKLAQTGDRHGPRFALEGERTNSGLFDIRPSAAGAAASASSLLLPLGSEPRRRGLVAMLVVAMLGVVLGAGVLMAILYVVQPHMVAALFKGDPVADPEVKPPRKLASAGPKNIRAPSALGPKATPAPPPDMSRAPDARPRTPDAGTTVVIRKNRREPAAAARSAPSKSRKKRKKNKRKRAGDIEVVDPDEGELDGPDAPEVPAPKPRSRPKPARGKGTELDRLIDGATGPKEVKPKTPDIEVEDGPGSAVPKLPRTLTREQVAAGMKRVMPAVRTCYRQHQQPGMVTISATVNGSGRVSQSTAVGGFAGTPSGACVEQAVRRYAVFPRFSGPPLTLKYPYMLR
jgi:hypothetical protein